MSENIHFFVTIFIILTELSKSFNAQASTGFNVYPAQVETSKTSDEWRREDDPPDPIGGRKLGFPMNGEGLTLREKLIRTLFENYKTHERPTEKFNTPTIIRVNMNIQAIFSVDVQTMDYFLDTLLRQTWTDLRLAWNHDKEFENFTQPLVSPTLKTQIWLPDLFFRNGKDGYLHKITLPNDLLRLYPNGDILYSQKITMRFSCEMDLHTFPMDTQFCHMNLGSYGYTLSELKFIWQGNRSVELPKKLEIPEFESPTEFELIDCSAEASTTTGNYSCLKAQFKLQRQISSYLVNTYIPNVLVIIVSWLSFYVSVDAAPARVPLGLMSLLCLLTQGSSVTANLPRVSYIKAIDIWLIFSIAFVIGVLVEYAVAIMLLRKRRRTAWRREVEKIVREELMRWSKACQNVEVCSMPWINNHVNKKFAPFSDLNPLLTNATLITAMANAPSVLGRSVKRKWMQDMTECEIDRYSRVLFPLCFAIYNIFYWVYYLILVK